MRTRWIHTIVLCGSIALGVAGCKDDKGSGGGGGGGGAAAADTSTPKAAAASFAKAMMAGDAAGMRATATGTDAQFKTAELMGGTAKAMMDLNAAAKEKFGADNALSKKMGGGDEMDATKLVERCDVKEEGDTATLVDKQNPNDKNPLKVKKVDGKWKVDLSSMKDLGADVEKRAPGMIKAANEVTADIKSGKIKDAASAAMAFGTKLAPELNAPGGIDIPAPPK